MPTTRPLTLQVICDEHRALAAMLRSVPLLLAELRRRQAQPDFAALRAMLFYLDNWLSQRQGAKGGKGLNENFARELMELHTLGVDGGYTQNDVTELARYALIIEQHYGRPMDIEWGKDGADGRLYIRDLGSLWCYDVEKK